MSNCFGCGLQIVDGKVELILDDMRGIDCDDNGIFAKVDGISIKFDSNGNITNAFDGAVTGSGFFSDIPAAVVGFDYDRTFLINNPYARQVCGVATLSYNARIGNDALPAQHLTNFTGAGGIYGAMLVNGAVQDISATALGGLLEQAASVGVLAGNNLRFLESGAIILHKSFCVPANASNFPLTLRMRAFWVGGTAPQINIQNIQLSWMSTP